MKDSCLFLHQPQKWRQHTLLYTMLGGGSHMTQPQCWEDENAQLLAQSLGVSPTSHVRWPCRDYIGKVINQQLEYVPR